MLYWDDMQGFRSFFSRKVWFWGRVFIYYFISVPLKSGQININQTIPEKGKN